MNIHYLNECLAFGIIIVDKIRNFVSFYRPPNQFEDMTLKTFVPTLS